MLTLVRQLPIVLSTRFRVVVLVYIMFLRADCFRDREFTLDMRSALTLLRPMLSTRFHVGALVYIMFLRAGCFKDRAFILEMWGGPIQPRSITLRDQHLSRPRMMFKVRQVLLRDQCRSCPVLKLVRLLPPVLLTRPRVVVLVYIMFLAMYKGRDRN